MPRPVVLGEVAPRRPGVQDPEDAVEDRAIIAGWSAYLAGVGPLREQGCDPVPLRIGELVAAHGGLQKYTCVRASETLFYCIRPFYFQTEPRSRQSVRRASFLRRRIRPSVSVESIDPWWLRSITPTRAVSLAVAPTIAPNKGRKAEWGRVTALAQSSHSESPRGTR